MDFSGEWAPVQDEDNTGNPYVGEFLGIPMSRAGSLRAAGVERVALHAAGVAVPSARRDVHLARAVAGPHLEGSRSELAPDHRVSRRVAALGRQSVLHGRARRARRRYAPHTWGGFSTAEFVGDMLKITTTHLKEDYYRRNGVPSSDEATLTQYWIRRGDILTWVTIAYDPLYLTEPMIRAANIGGRRNQQIPPYPCTAVEEVDRPQGVVPHYLPGTNPFLTEFGEKYQLPTRGHARRRGRACIPSWRASSSGQDEQCRSSSDRAGCRGIRQRSTWSR